MSRVSQPSDVTRSTRRLDGVGRGRVGEPDVVGADECRGGRSLLQVAGAGDLDGAEVDVPVLRREPCSTLAEPTKPATNDVAGSS